VRERSHIQKVARAPCTWRECLQDSHNPTAMRTHHRAVLHIETYGAPRPLDHRQKPVRVL